MAKFKLITAILTHKTSKELQTLLEQHGIYTSNKQHARGSSLISNTDIEVDILTLVVEESRSDDIFELLYTNIHINENHHGILYQSALKNATAYSLPQI